MKLLALALFASSAAAFTSTGSNVLSKTALNSAKAELEEVAAKANPVLKFWDPMDFLTLEFDGFSNEETINFIRHAEIKHCRVAMAAFVGYIVQSTGFHFPFPIDLAGDSYPTMLSPPEQWDALPFMGKVQIISLVGFLELFSEGAGTHYMKGGRPGEFPNFSDHPEWIPHPVPLNLFDPFGFSKSASAETKATGLVKELNNGRLAMVGILGFLSEQKLEGSVPLLKGIVAPYAGEPMAPF